ncbi:MAG: glycosyltransferase [Thaumarchaeota archaeon]|nr:glycosyltransferase [Nitrososphaerota archaeon]
MKVSIIIPVYNATKYIDECIKSALDQTYEDIEVIAVDDGSKDDSLQKLQKYTDKIKIISKKNGGTPTALNSGIKVMTGEWFKWLSADDLLEKNAIEVLINETKQLGNNSKLCILYSNYDLIDHDSKIVGEFIEPNYNQLGSFQQSVILLDHYYGNGTTSLIHKSLFDKFGLFDEKIGFQEDYEFWLRCCIFHNCNLHLIPQKLARYRIHEGQLTKKKINESLVHANLIRNLILNKLPIDKKNLYLEALKKYRKQKPMSIRVRRQIRDIMIRVLPKNMSSSIIQSYVNGKKTN